MLEFRFWIASESVYVKDLDDGDLVCSTIEEAKEFRAWFAVDTGYSEMDIEIRDCLGRKASVA